MVAKDIWKRNWGGGNMEWKCYKIDELIDEISMGPFGSDVKKEFYVKKGVPILNGSNLQGFKLQEDSFGYLTEEKAKTLKKCIAQKGDIIVTHRGTLGQIVYVPKNSKYDKYVISQSQFRFRCKKDLVDVPYLVYYFHTREGQHKILANASQVGVPALARATSTFRRIEICLPPLAIQRRIASILSSLDRKIELNNKINADLEEMAQAIFKNWFVDFEPFKDGKFVDSELGMIPEGWKVGTLKDLLYLRKDSIKAVNKGNLPYLPIDTIPMHCLVATDFKSNDEAKSSLQTFEQNDIVVGAMRVYFHRVILAPCKGITRTTCFVLSVKNENALAYSLMQCNQDEAISFAEKTSKGSTMPYAVWDGGYGEYKVVIPPDEVMKSFNDLLGNFFSKMNKNAIENSRLSLLRDTLLPRLMSGEIEIPE